MAISRKGKPSSLRRSVHDLFTGPLGKRVLADLNKIYHARSSYHKDPHMMAYREGQRAIILMLNDYVNKPEQEEIDINGPTDEPTSVFDS